MPTINKIVNNEVVINKMAASFFACFPNCCSYKMVTINLLQLAKWVDQKKIASKTVLLLNGN